LLESPCASLGKQSSQGTTARLKLQPSYSKNKNLSFEDVRFIARFRLGHHHLEVEQGRFSNTLGTLANCMKQIDNSYLLKVDLSEGLPSLGASSTPWHNRICKRRSSNTRKVLIRCKSLSLGARRLAELIRESDDPLSLEFCRIDLTS
jgi:hypothetical protein